MSDTISEVLKIFTNNWNKQVILYGPPGTSKTYSATIIAAAMLCGSNLNSMSPSYYIDSNKLLSEDALLKKLKDILKGKQQTNQTEIDDYDLYKASSEFLKTRNNYKLVQFHPSYSYEDFVRGIKVVKITNLCKN